MAACTECVHSALDIFTSPGLQTSVEHGEWMEFRPLSTLDEGPVEFLIKGGTDYLDLAHTFLQIKAKVVKPDGGNLTQPESAFVSTTNLLLHSMFSELDVYLNGVQVTSPSGCYPYKAYLQTLLSYSPEVKKSQLEASMFYMDTAEHFEAISGNDNEGAQRRRSRMESSKVVDMVGRLHADIFHQAKYLLSHVDVRLKLSRSKDAFTLLSTAPPGEGHTAKAVKIELVDASLFVRKVRISPVITLAHARALEKSNAKYPLTRTVTRVFSAAGGSFSFQEDNLFVDRVPTRIIVGLVNQQAFNGSYGLNPFHLNHYDLNYFCVFLNGNQIPSKALRPDFHTGSEDVMRAYMSLYYTTNAAWKDITCGINLTEFIGGSTLFCLDLTPSLADSADSVEIQRSGPLRIEIQFKTALPHPVNVIVYAEFEGQIEITKSRDILTNFGA